LSVQNSFDHIVLDASQIDQLARFAADRLTIQRYPVPAKAAPESPPSDDLTVD
jgi:hypothetical protein